MFFSQRIGKKPKEKPIQIDSIDEELKNSLWSVIYFSDKNRVTRPELVEGIPCKSAIVTLLLTRHYKI
jgi:hypothetical protein